VKEEVRVTVVSHDGSGRINPLAVCTAHAVWSVEGGEGAVGRTEEAVRRSACVIVEPRDGPRRVDALGYCECGARRIEAGADAFGRPQEAVTDAACVKIGSGDGPGWVDGLATRPLKKADIGTCGNPGDRSW
jgi:hypothetical protein